jgi:hypothetical protein
MSQQLGGTLNSRAHSAPLHETHHTDHLVIGVMAVIGPGAEIVQDPVGGHFLHGIDQNGILEGTTPVPFSSWKKRLCRCISSSFFKVSRHIIVAICELPLSHRVGRHSSLGYLSPAQYEQLNSSPLC